jgi:acyl dehydratase
MTASASYRVRARNLSHASENRIHDDDVARQFGFQGGLVPGVEVYAYMTHLPVARWGVAWLERGTAECRFAKPVYDGRFADVVSSEEGTVLSITVESEGERCATGQAALADTPAEAPSKRPAEARSLGAVTPIPKPDERPEADEKTLAIGRRLSSHPLCVTCEYLAEYVSAIGETEPLYLREGLVHPALFLRLCNSALKDNVKLGPWIHTGSAIRHHALAHAGESLTAEAEVAANYARKGHRFVDLDVSIVAGRRGIAQVRHTAIYRLRSAAHA